MATNVCGFHLQYKRYIIQLTRSQPGVDYGRLRDDKYGKGLNTITKEMLERSNVPKMDEPVPTRQELSSTVFGRLDQKWALRSTTGSKFRCKPNQPRKAADKRLRENKNKPPVNHDETGLPELLDHQRTAMSGLATTG